ncbi:hypothetical protein F2P81_024262 [Scophthalmus maximus]|uniref:Uncharacterized protein n=1 Tax=Scophthalmus maximus TaxID=52904 RepID=A0A6A4RWX9_SCOMX|nr:hypothetical protein F2P81_024262 [Scophthalmus maximus]
MGQSRQARGAAGPCVIGVTLAKRRHVWGQLVDTFSRFRPSANRQHRSPGAAKRVHLTQVTPSDAWHPSGLFCLSYR